jgi:ABC-type lipoprotein release transport system permease subunit
VARQANRSAGASRSWLLGATRDRVRAQWRLLIAVIAVAVLANTLITTLGLLVTATEQQGARGSLTAIPADQTTVDVRLVNLTGSAEEAEDAVIAAVHTTLGESVAFTSAAVAIAGFAPLADAPDESPAIAYFGQLDDIESHAALTSGSWATATQTAAGLLPVAMPATAARARGLAVGSTLTIELQRGSVTAEVVGLYTAETDDENYWAVDPLLGAGNDPAHPKPGTGSFVPIEALGPLVVAPGALAVAEIPVSTLQLAFHPDFGSAQVDDLAPLLQRLDSASVDIRLEAGRVAEQLVYASDAATVIESVTSGLVVTRSTVVVVSLLLLVLAVAAMSQTARLLSDSRAGERRLMRSRGASAGHIVALTATEAIAIGAVTTAVSPLLAAAAYRLVAAQPAMVAAGMPSGVDVSPLALATSALVSIVFVLVLIAPLVGRARAIVEDDQAAARPRRAAGFMRSGLDLALVALAGLAYWQLISYRGVIDASASLTIDPILAVGPALVLLAGALLCVRLIPAASYLVERVGSRSDGTIIPLASWELGRRSQRAVSAVLLLSLALAVGTFGLSFLSTWRQSQLDQATLAVGAPVRMTADPDSVMTQDVAGTPGPVFRRFGLLNLGEDGSDGTVVQLLGLSEPARELIDRGRMAEVGGSQIGLMLRPPVVPIVGIAIPEGARRLSATARIVDASALLGAETGTLRGVIEDAQGLITTVDFGAVAVDGATYDVTATLPAGSGLRFVGLQAGFDGDFAEGAGPLVTADVSIYFGALAAGGTSLGLGPSSSWSPFNADPLGDRVTTGTAPDGLLGLNVVVTPGRASAFSLVGWKPDPAITAVVPAELAERFQLQPGSLITITTQAAEVQVKLGAFAKTVPGAATADELEAMGFGLSAGGSRASTVVVDQQALARALAQAGVAGAMVDEWWLDDGLAALSTKQSTYSSAVLGTQLQEAPLRVATQAALWVSIVAGALLAAVGFAMHSAATLRARRVELAQLRAVGLTRRGLLALVGAESLLLCALGIVFGVAIGILLAFLVGPLVAVSPNGTAPVPSVIVDIPLASIGLLALEMVAVLGLVVLVVARAQRYTQPADLLRGGVEP